MVELYVWWILFLQLGRRYYIRTWNVDVQLLAVFLWLLSSKRDKTLSTLSSYRMQYIAQIVFPLRVCTSYLQIMFPCLLPLHSHQTLGEEESDGFIIPSFPFLISSSCPGVRSASYSCLTYEISGKIITTTGQVCLWGERWSYLEMR